MKSLRAILLGLAVAVASAGAAHASELVVVTSFPKELFEGYKKAFEAAAPRMSRAGRAVSSAICTLFILAIEICCGRTLPSSLRRPSWSDRSWAFVISVIIHTSFCCTSWNEPMGLPNWMRCCAYWSAQS